MELFKSSLSILATDNCIGTAIFGNGQICDNCNGSATMQIIAYVLHAMTIGVGILAVIGIMIFGIKYLTSRGDPGQAQKARRHLFEVLIGLVAYVLLVLGASWLLPGDTTTIVLSGSPKTCPDITETVIHVVGDDEDDDPNDDGDTTEGDDSINSTTNEWKSGKRPRECGPGKPGNFQTLTYQKDEKGEKVWVYTNSAGRTYFQYAQSDSRWGSKQMKCYKKMSTISSCGCAKTTYAMLSESYSSGQRYIPTPNSDGNHSSNFGKNQKRCSGNRAQRIKCAIDNGGTVVVHASGSGKSHWFPIVDYRVKNGKTQYYVLNTNSLGKAGATKWNGIYKTGWGTFNSSYKYKLYFYYGKKNAANLDCRVK